MSAEEVAMDELLTNDERAAIHLLARVANLFARIVEDGPSRDGDLAEAVHRIHDLQHAVMAQAAARAYPDTYRLLGGTVGRPT